ncbi:MAG: 2-C-methyl-D-erythritol 4-phosphate cytidylyltransferase [Chloroflexota bacterium]|nr:2-C-methyl-D-erythritol 4-phosphate cytidylyltransferase [Chloroflexota bacterium]
MKSDGAFAAAIVVAAGCGTRFGDPNKALFPLRGRPLIAYCLDALETAWCVHDIIVVAGEHTRDRVAKLVAAGDWTKITYLVIGGNRRQDSVVNGMRQVRADREVVLLHDAARPLARPSLFNQTATRARDVGAAIAAIPITDTIKRVEGCSIQTTIARDGLWASQTPQAFQRALLADALASPTAQDLIYTDEAALLEALGVPVEVVLGSLANFKLTREEDVPFIETLLAAADREPIGDAPTAARA